MNRSVRLLTALAVLLAALTGCGIPDQTSVVVHGTGPPPRPTTAGVTPNTPKLRDEATDRGQFVANYLAAAAGPLDGAAARVREFVSPEARTDFKPAPQIHVVRLTENPLISPGTDEVRLKVQKIGVLGASGTLEPPTDEVTEYRLEVREAQGPPSADSGWYLREPPQVLLLSDVALAEFYQARSIYFWNRERTALVPDLRYLPRATPPESQPNQILRWLTDGPSDWLKDAVEPLPEDTAAIGNVPYVGDGRLRINLTAAAVPADEPQALQRLGWQLMWSMRTNLTTALELRIANDLRHTFTGQDFLRHNPAYLLGDRPERFCVYRGQVRRMTTSENAETPVPMLTEVQNKRVESAALSRSGDTTYAALVTVGGAGKLLLTGGARTGTAAAFRSADLPPGSVGQPVWLRPAGEGPRAGSGLLPAGGGLLHIRTNGTDPEPVRIPKVAGRVSAVAAAPDGLRVAIVADGQLYVTVLADDGNALQPHPARLVRTSLVKITGVDWTAENSVVVVGNERDTNRVAIIDSTIDGGVQSPRLNDLGLADVTHLVAYPANPITSTTTTDSVADALVAYVANGVAYDLSGVPDQIQPDEVVGVPPGANTNRPLAPFFLR